MNNPAGKVYIGTILLEKNRWATPKTPSYRVSEWLDRFAAAGFDGMELWEYHATRCGDDELAALAASPVPVAVFNTYCGFEDDARAGRLRAAELTRRLGAGGVKFNVGKDPARRGEYLHNLRAWAEMLPDRCRVLCECHGGTILERPADARAFFDEAGAERFGVIVHCFADDPAVLTEWLDRFGPAVAHAHVALRDAGRSVRLDRRGHHVEDVLAILHDAGYAGSFTLEFTEGTGEPDESIEPLWRAALADLRFLRERSDGRRDG